MRLQNILDVNGMGTLRILESIRNLKLGKKVLSISSSEMFAVQTPQSEKVYLPPKPLRCRKIVLYWITKIYRDAYNIYASNKFCLIMKVNREILS